MPRYSVRVLWKEWYEKFIEVEAEDKFEAGDIVYDLISDGDEELEGEYVRSSNPEIDYAELIKE